MLSEEAVPAPDECQQIRDAFYEGLPGLLRAAGRGDWVSLSAAIGLASRCVGPVSAAAGNRMITGCFPALMEHLEQRIAGGRADVGEIEQ